MDDARGPAALERLDVFVGEWTMAVTFPNVPPGSVPEPAPDAERRAVDARFAKQIQSLQRMVVTCASTSCNCCPLVQWQDRRLWSVISGFESLGGSQIFPHGLDPSKVPREARDRPYGMADNLIFAVSH